MNEIIEKIKRIAMYVFPAVIMILNVLKLTGVIQIVETVETIFYIVIAAAIGIIEVLYDQQVKKLKAKLK